MKTTKEVNKQEAKVSVLKCERCGEEYIYDSYTRICPGCGGMLQKAEIIVDSGYANGSIR
jgi:Zn finger protein HypA/HybF involved in hydrogenase expression